MDNDNKIDKENEEEVRDLVEQSKLVFLKEIIDDFRRKQSQYDLGKEFAKTKKNRSPIVPLIILGISALFLIGAVAVTYYIQETSKNISVNIREFEDVNLKDVLDAAKRNEQEMEAARRDLNVIISARDDEVGTLREQANSEINIINAEQFSNEEKNRRSAGVRTRLDKRVNGINAAYAPKISAKEKEIAEIQKRMDEYDSRQIERARKQEEILNNQQRLFEIQMEKTTKYFEDQIASLNSKNIKEIEALKAHQKELIAVLKANHAKDIAKLILKYNPKLTDPAVTDLFGKGIDPAVYRSAIPAFEQKFFEQERILVNAEVQDFRRQFAEYSAVLGVLKKIPYENSVPPLIQQIEGRQKLLLLEYEKFLSAASAVLKEKNAAIGAREKTIAAQEKSIAALESVLSQYTFALDQLLKTSRENGYILDPRDPMKIKVLIDKVRQISDGTVGMVFRRDDEYIGKIRLFAAGGEFFGNLIELNSQEKPLRPFDKVLIQEK